MRIGALAGAGVALTLLLTAFVLLFSCVPPGWTPFHGFAPDVPALYRRVFPLPRWSFSPLEFQRVATVLLLAVWTLYAAAAVGLGRLRDPAERRRVALLVACVAGVAHLALVLLPPALSKDLYRYALYGKMVADHGLNPLVTPADALAGDPLLALTSWTHQRSLYGPTFLWLASVVVRVAGDDPVALGIAFKALAALGNLTTCALVWRLAREEGDDGLRPLLLCAWNPVALVETAGAGHTEAIMIPLALAGLLLARRRRPLAAVAALVAAAAVKYLVAVLLPIVVAHLVAAEAAARRPVLAARMLLAAAGAALALYAPFWGGLVMFTEPLAHLAGAVGAPRAGGATWISLGAFSVVLAVLFRAAASPSFARAAPLAALAIDAFIVLVFPFKFPWYFLPSVALSAPFLGTRLGRLAGLISLLLAVLSMLLYAALVLRPPAPVG